MEQDRDTVHLDNLPEQWHIVTADGEIKHGPFTSELAAHNKLKALKDKAIDDECDDLTVQ